MKNLDINKELLIEAIELHLKGRHLDSDSLNVIAEYAPLIHEEIAKTYGMTRGELRQYVGEHKYIELNDLKRVILGTTLSPINSKTNQPYFEIKPEGWGDGWKAGEVSEFDFIDDKLVPVKPK